MIAFIEKQDHSLCCGCGACISACTHNALSFNINKEGFKEPVLDKSLCVDCGICSMVCPMMNANKTVNNPTDVYAAINKDRDTLESSSSGGVFSAVAEYVLNNGGIVYGAAFDSNLNLRHIRITKSEELFRLRGSKYLQSDMDGVISNVREDLKNGKFVYFVGVPCQVAGLKLFLHKDYVNLLTTDIVCHGVPSQKMFNVFTDKFQDKRNVKIIDYKFRDKRVNGWSCSSSSSCKKNDKILNIYFDKILNAYMKAFLSGSINRESCYCCPYATSVRAGDITLADYWGVKKFHQNINARQGVSLLLVNTKKGNEVVRKIRNKIDLIPSKLEWAVSENPNLSHPTLRPQIRDFVYASTLSNPEKYIALFFDKNHTIKLIKFTLKRHVKSTPWLYNFLLKFKQN